MYESELDCHRDLIDAVTKLSEADDWKSAADEWSIDDTQM